MLEAPFPVLFSDWNPARRSEPEGGLSGVRSGLSSMIAKGGATEAIADFPRVASVRVGDV